MKNLKWLFYVVIFINSFLLFLIEPMFNRMILPVAGGSLSIWNIALMCFQLLLLGGYTYTHYLPKIIGYKAYMKVHISLLLISTFFSFWFFKVKPWSINTNTPTLDIIFILLTTIGLPYFVVSTSSTNFQNWYFLSQNKNPYHLYALSNTGNLLALISYGVGIEVLWGLKHQILTWNIVFAFASLLGVGIGIHVYRNLKSFKPLQKESSQVKEPIVFKRKMYWVLLSFIPCSLMIATNTLLGNRINVASVPYYWILPLAIYLVAYIIAFSKIKLFDVHIYEKLAFWLILIILSILFIDKDDLVYKIAMLVLFMVSLVCNVYITKNEPEESNLTEFYLYIAIGGAFGGVFSSLIAPALFNNIFEYPIIIIIFLLTLYAKHQKEKIEFFTIESWEYSILGGIGLYIFIIGGLSLQTSVPLILLLGAFIIRRVYAYSKTRLISLVVLVSLTSGFDAVVLEGIDYQARNFYGVKTVTHSNSIDGQKTDSQLLNLLVVGNTLHGAQFKKGMPNEFESLTYYDKKGSTIGRFLTTHSQQIKMVGVVGLGVGSLSGMSEPHQKWKYFEIDPQVTEIAENPSYFTMLDKYQPQVVTGDARITLQNENDNSYDVLVLDAYSGDIIPTNLLTREAVYLYQQKLKKNGILFFHISNRQFDLKPVLSTVSESIGMDCYVDTATSKGTILPAESVWVMMTNSKDLVSSDWTKIEAYPDFELWTDDKHSIATILKK